MKRRLLLTAALVAGTTTWAIGQASAQTVPHTPITTPVNPGFFYWSIGASGGIRHLPRWHYGQTFDFAAVGLDNVSDAFAYNPKPWGAGPEFVMGYALNRGGPLGGVGDRPRIELALSTFFGKSHQRTGPAGSGGFLWVPHVDGSPSGFGYTFNDDIPATLTTTVYSGEAALRFKTGFRLSRNLELSPSVAAIGGMSFYRYRWETNQPGLEIGGSVYDVKETIRSWQAGGELALQLKWTPSQTWSVFGSVAAAAMYRHSHMRGKSQFLFDFGGGSEVLETANVSDNHGGFVWRLGAEIGVTYDWGWARLTLSGFGYWDSAVPQIDNPRIVNGTTLDGSPARLTTSGEWAYGGRIAIVFPLYKQRY